jgi:hypothetical protein
MTAAVKAAWTPEMGMLRCFFVREIHDRWGENLTDKSVVRSVGAEDVGDLVCGESADFCVSLLAFGCGGGLWICGLVGCLLGQERSVEKD